MQMLDCQVSSYKYFRPYSNEVEKLVSKTDKKIYKARRFFKVLIDQRDSFVQRGFRESLKKHRLDKLKQDCIARLQFFEEENRKAKAQINYKKLSSLGDGAYSSVLKIESCLDGKKYALKIAKSSEKEKNYLRHESIILRILNRKEDAIGKSFVVKILGTFLFNDKLALLELLYKMDLVDFSKIKRIKDVSSGLVVEIFLSVLKSIVFVHESGFIHRDIKLENIFVTENVELKLADFGFAVAKKDCPPQNWGGTRLYQSPEYLISKDFCDFALDVWAAGRVAEVFYLHSLNKMFGQNKNTLIFEQQYRLNQPFPEFLQEEIEARSLSRSFVRDESFEEGSFEEIMRRENSRKISDDKDLFELLLEGVKRAFTFDYRKRPSARDLLDFLECEYQKLLIRRTGNP